MLWQAANEAVGEGSASADNFKFFFNHCEWLPGALANEVHPLSFRVVMGWRRLISLVGVKWS